MDLESECSVHESVEDNEVNPESVFHADDNKIRNNGFCSDEIGELRNGEIFHASPLLGGREGNGVENFQPASSPPFVVQSPGDGSPPVKKGYGLKKWRRIRRDVVEDGGSSLDSGKVLKRGLSAPVNPAKPSHSSVEAVNMAKHSARASSSDSRFGGGNGLDDNVDRSSKSSTTTSMPKAMHDLPARGKSRVKNSSGKSSSNSSQRVQQTKSQTESSRKHRKVKNEEENSHSSLESDSRSTNFVSTQGTANSNGKISETSLNFDGENGDEAHASEREEMQAGSTKENAEEGEDISPDESAADLSWEAREERNENQQSSTDRDPLVESILTLQSVHEALEKELGKFGEIGEEYTGLEPSSSDQMGYAKIRQSPSSLETRVLKSTQKVKLLENELENVRNMVRERDSRVAKLLSTLSERYKEMEAQFEGLYKQKMEAEIEGMVIATEMRNYTVHVVDQVKTLQKLEDAENGCKITKEEENENLDSDLLGTDEIVNEAERRVWRIGYYFFIQLILLMFVVWLFLSQFSPQFKVVVVVPT